MSTTPHPLFCLMVPGCLQPVAYIDHKGYTYCAAHGPERRKGGTACRKLAASEVKALQRGDTISYRRAKKKAAPTAPAAPIGKHYGCQGAVFYTSTPSRSWRHCERCGASSLRGDPIELEVTCPKCDDGIRESLRAQCPTCAAMETEAHEDRAPVTPPDMTAVLPERYQCTVDADGEKFPAADRSELPKWSHPDAPPAVGAVLDVREEFQGRGPLGKVTVVGYDIEHEWLYLVCRTERTDLQTTYPGLVYVAGRDLLVGRPLCGVCGSCTPVAAYGSYVCANAEKEAREEQLEARRFHVVSVNDKTGERIRLTATPVTHREGCTILSKFGPHPSPHVRRKLEEVEDVDEQSALRELFRDAARAKLTDEDEVEAGAEVTLSEGDGIDPGVRGVLGAYVTARGWIRANEVASLVNLGFTYDRDNGLIRKRGADGSMTNLAVES